MGRFLKTLTVGGILGFVAGLLFAPSKGDETRKKVQDAIDKGKSKLDELKSEIGGSCCKGDDSCCK